MSKQDILHFLSTHKSEIQQRFGVTSIGLFGSFARDEERDDSDIDIAVEITSPNKFRSFFDLLYYLEDGLHKKVDLGIESSLKSIVRQEVHKEIIYV